MLSSLSASQANGAVTSGPSLAVEVNGLKLPNPFVIGSGPPGTNYAVSCRGPSGPGEGNAKWHSRWPTCPRT